MHICNFNEHYLNPLLEKLSKKKNDKKVFLICDFNINPLKFDTSEHINKFMNDLCSNCLHPQILLPTQIIGIGKTIVDNMFSNIAEPLIKNVASGNITFSICDHLPQFFFLPDYFSNNYIYKRNAEVYDWSRFNKDSFLDDFNLTNWNSVVEIEKNDVNISFNNYLSKVNSLIMSHVPIKKLNKQQQKFLQKPWFTTAIQNSIHKKNKLFKKYIKCQKSVTKNDLHRDHKSYRNKLSTIMKESKRKYYNDYFRTNLKNIKNTWKGIKSIISLKCKVSDIPTIIKDKGTFLTAPKDIANSFNKFFCLVVPSIQSKINVAYKFFNHFLKNLCHHSFFIKPCTNKEIIDIISDLSRNKATGPNSIPIKIMK